MSDINNCSSMCLSFRQTGQACPTCHNKKPGRRPKYNSDEERKGAQRAHVRKCLRKLYDKKKEETMLRQDEKMKNEILNKLEKLKTKHSVDLIYQTVQQLQAQLCY